MSDNNIFSYTKRDYAGSRKEGLSKIPTLSGGVWTDLNATDPGIIILDYVHALVDMVNYYQDHQALETFITTAKERANIFRIAKQLSYKISSAKGSKVIVTFQSKFLYDHDIKIPKYTKLSTRDSIEFITTEVAYLKAGESSVDVLCQQGKVRTKTYTGTGYSRFSNVEPPANVNQSITLTADNIDIDSISVTEIKENTTIVWDPVDFIAFSTEHDKVYQIDLNSDNSVTIKFGDGERGVVPLDTDVLTITYITNDAEKGKIGEKAIIKVEDIYDAGKYVEFIVYNSEASVGGTSPQSSTSIRELAPGAIKAQGRAVTLSDFENLAKLVDGVSDAKAYDINTNPDIPYHEVRVLIIPSDARNNILLKEVHNYLYQRMIPPTNLNVIFPYIVPININLKIKKMSTSIDSESLKEKIENTVKDYFLSRSSEIGEYFYPADLSIQISALPEVKYVVSMTPTDIVEVPDFYIAELGDLKVEVL